MNKKLNGTQKAAVFLLSLGPALSSKVLKYFNETEIERISMEIANTTKVDSGTLEEVLDEFMVLTEAQRYILDGGMNYAKEVLEQTVGHSKASEILKRLKETSQIRPFTFMRQADPKQMVNLISQEHPQTIALILSYLLPEQASIVLSSLPEEQQTDIAKRIALMERTSPEILKEIESVLKEKLSSVVNQDFTSAGGVASVVDILNQADRGTEKSILEGLETEDPALAEEIRKRMFIFEDVISLDDPSIQRIIREVDSKELAMALKGASEEVKDRIMKNISKRAGEMLQEDLEFMGPVRLREVEEAQQKIVGIIRKLDEVGEIIISRGGDDAVVL